MLPVMSTTTRSIASLLGLCSLLHLSSACKHCCSDEKVTKSEENQQRGQHAPARANMWFVNDYCPLERGEINAAGGTDTSTFISCPPGGGGTEWDFSDDVTYPDGSILHIEFWVTGTLKRTNVNNDSGCFLKAHATFRKTSTGLVKISAASPDIVDVVSAGFTQHASGYAVASVKGAGADLYKLKLTYYAPTNLAAGETVAYEGAYIIDVVPPY